MMMMMMMTAMDADHHTNDDNIIGKKKMESKGRQKVEIKKVEASNKRHVTFSKRKKGLFKKAAELSVLCGAEVAAIVVSANGKLFPFGIPSCAAVIDRYLNALQGRRRDLEPGENYENAPGNTWQKRQQCLEARRQLEAEKRSRDGGCWWEGDQAIERMSLEELERYKAALLKLKHNVEAQTSEMIRSTNPNSNFSSLLMDDIY